MTVDQLLDDGFAVGIVDLLRRLADTVEAEFRVGDLFIELGFLGIEALDERQRFDRDERRVEFAGESGVGHGVKHGRIVQVHRQQIFAERDRRQRVGQRQALDFRQTDQRHQFARKLGEGAERLELGKFEFAEFLARRFEVGKVLYDFLEAQKPRVAFHDRGDASGVIEFVLGLDRGLFQCSGIQHKKSAPAFF